MSYYLGDRLAALEDAVCADAYFEGLGSLGMTSAQRVQAENRQWKYTQHHGAGAPNQMIFKPTVIGGGVGDRVRDGKGWRDKTGAERAAGVAAKAGQTNMAKERQAQRPKPEQFGPPKPSFEQRRDAAHAQKMAQQAQRQKELWGGQKSTPAQSERQFTPRDSGPLEE